LLITGHIFGGAGTANPSGTPEFTPGFNGVCVTRSLVVCVCFVDRCLSFCPFSFGHCVVCSSAIHVFWLLFGIFKLFKTTTEIFIYHCIITGLVSSADLCYHTSYGYTYCSGYCSGYYGSEYCSYYSSRQLSWTYQQWAGVITKFSQHLNDNSCEDDKSKYNSATPLAS
jgi:hypothetical protein